MAAGFTRPMSSSIGGRRGIETPRTTSETKAVTYATRWRIRLGRLGCAYSVDECMLTVFPSHLLPEVLPASDGQERGANNMKSKYS